MARSRALRSIRSSARTRYPMAPVLLRPSTAVPRDPWHPAPSQWPVSRLVSAKLRYRTAMDHVEHVLIVGTSMPIGIAWRIRGEVKAFTASSQVSKYMTAVCKTVGSAYVGPNRTPATHFRRSEPVTLDCVTGFLQSKGSGYTNRWLCPVGYPWAGSSRPMISPDTNLDAV